MLEWLLLAVLALTILAVSAILAVVMEELPEAESVKIVDPAVSRELSRIAREKGTKPHKRFAYDPKTREAVLVQSNSIDRELEHEDIVTVDVRR